ncbi:hypothetical protein K1T35_47480 (plasmid) [Pseudonocardia sp. DSM 110487]|uniref:hypothetical protein n=1 Tax=Pseudonocardia sp. DSM 110487 TaxID=2865833 RepID=UPI001C696FD9|nr:hypothetical protein [Pseudonocardia sp. DSM 110487]QYN40992.1 hypothetical protein K1T35_47480 [Pseudonocardia sp. DSM 110487]
MRKKERRTTKSDRRELSIAAGIFVASVLALLAALLFTDLAAQYEARNCVTVGKSTHCD